MNADRRSVRALLHAVTSHVDQVYRLLYRAECNVERLRNENADLRNQLGAANETIRNMIDTELCRDCYGKRFG
jgi:hypothetical protein